MGIMIIPYVSSLSEDAMRAVPMSLREGAYAMGANRIITALKVVYPAALSGIVASYILAISRAIGETMIVAIAAGMQPNLTARSARAGGNHHRLHRAGQPRRSAARQHRLSVDLRRRYHAFHHDADLQYPRLHPAQALQRGVLSERLQAHHRETEATGLPLQHRRHNLHADGDSDAGSAAGRSVDGRIAASELDVSHFVSHRALPNEPEFFRRGWARC